MSDDRLPHAEDHLRVVECAADAAGMWNTFVHITPGATVCHRFEWKAIVEGSYGLDTYYLAVLAGDNWIGVMPVVLMPSFPWSSRKGVSLAFCSYGDLLAAPDRDEEALRRLCLDYLRRHDIARLELRRLAPGAMEAGEVTMLLDLGCDSERLWNGLKDKVRNQVRKAQKAGLSGVWGNGQIDDLYRIYAHNMGRLGTPVHSRNFFRALVAEFGDDARVLTVRMKGEAIASMLLLRHGDTWSNPFASSMTEFNKFNPNMLLYWEALTAACGSGVRTFDFGRSAFDSGTYRFKAQWGAQPVALNYRTFDGGVYRAAVSTDVYRGTAGKLASGLWRQVPEWMQLWLGPHLRRWIP